MYTVPPLLVQCAEESSLIRQTARRERNTMSVVETVLEAAKYTYEVHEDAQVPPAGTCQRQR